ncbi:uncharacterized protein LOC133505021 isoform X4 [Syngnathoides biaculeatus]|uniref:uncharacterized protein LOC133505021 isoform X4 n=1 Tax=Syngnathoides biaculeatus TaxID=300417 RepID=UPI002ADE7034|nr:uncharacterized protein LOC133505021 isoform X4 [Syngnathoides biaculeatus]XP_061683837.1 uncharacterized protein LOC133505021 isoform X4 [Syngnathoides biaculeatus]
MPMRVCSPPNCRLASPPDFSWPSLMSSCVFLLNSLLVAALTPDLRPSPGPPDRGGFLEARSRDPGKSAVVRVLEGEAAWLRCPLSRRASFSNLSSSHELLWYRLPPGQHLKEPITHSARLSKEDDMLYFQPAAAEDKGSYVCQLGRCSECVETAARVSVVRPCDLAVACPGGVRECDLPVAVAPAQAAVPLQSGDTLDCPDWQEARRMADAPPAVTWYHECVPPSGWTRDRQQVGPRLQIHSMLDHYQGVYRCQVRYRRAGRALHFTRGVNVTAVCERPARPHARTHAQTFRRACPKSRASCSRRPSTSSPSSRVRTCVWCAGDTSPTWIRPTGPSGGAWTATRWTGWRTPDSPRAAGRKRLDIYRSKMPARVFNWPPVFQTLSRAPNCPTVGWSDFPKRFDDFKFEAFLVKAMSTDGGPWKTPKRAKALLLPDTCAPTTATATRTAPC